MFYNLNSLFVYKRSYLTSLIFLGSGGILKVVNSKKQYYLTDFPLEMFTKKRLVTFGLINHKHIICLLNFPV